MNENLEKDILLYHWDFVDPPPNDYFCSHCNEVFTRPMIIECCGGHFCASCIEKQYGNLYRCPDCKEENIAAILDKRMWKRILELDVQCPFSNHGCLWTGELSARAAHLAESCKHVEAKCKYGCNEKLEMNELAEHLEHFCPNRPVTCPYCNERGRHEYISGEHKNECLEFLINCPNNCEIKDIKRRDLNQHLIECRLEIIECDYSYAGCTAKIKRMDMTEHYQTEVQTHMALMTEYFATKLQEKENALNLLIEEKDRELEQLIEHHSQELKEKDKKIAKLIKEREEEIEHRLKEHDKEINQKLEKIVEEFEHKYEELKLNISRITHLSIQFPQNDESAQLEMTSLLHKGKNEIWLGTYASKEVAIKRHLSDTSPSEILQEANKLSKLIHTNIITLHITVTTEEPVCMILEYISNGNLKDYLQKNPVLLLHQQILICKQIAFGLDYLQRKFCIHRCVRTDNVLVGENLTCKISDFSSAVFVHSHDESYVALERFNTEIKWSAPEVLEK